MNPGSVRVRFAPSPTGFMHLGNVRAALVNYLYAHQKNGVFILRIEDTDQARNVDPEGRQIIADLAWLNLPYQEGPIVGGPYAPYYQSERSSLYQEHLEKLKKINLVYRCFCTPEELEKRRQRQLALKMPPRYDRKCLQLSQQEIDKNLAEHKPFIWRFKLPDTIVQVTDLARGTITYDLKHFSDFPLTRADGSFTFIFANFVDDLTMKITHIFRGEDHLSNTGVQAALYGAFTAPIPVFWHLPIMSNAEGKKLSKRDFGFSLNDLRNAGFLPEAIDNYLAIIGGGTFTNEIMSLEELAKSLDFSKTTATGFVRYDTEKLKWVNHKWLGKLSLEDLAQRAKPFIVEKYPEAKKLSTQELAKLLEPIRNDLVTLADAAPQLSFYFTTQEPNQELLVQHNIAQYKNLLTQILSEYTKETFNPELFLQKITQSAKEQKIPAKDIFALLRIALTGTAHGPSIKDLITILGTQESFVRLQKLIK